MLLRMHLQSQAANYKQRIVVKANEDAKGKLPLRNLNKMLKEDSQPKAASIASSRGKALIIHLLQ